MCCYRPTVALDDPLADGKPHPCAFVCASPVQPLKKGKDALGILFIEADAVIFNEYLPAFGFSIRAFGRFAVDLDHAWLFSMEFQSI